MPISRRSLLKAAATVPALSLPGIVRAEAQSTLRFIPVIDPLEDIHDHSNRYGSQRVYAVACHRRG